MLPDSLKAVVRGIGRPRNLGAYALNATVPRRGYRVERDLAYGPKARHRLDLYVPQAQGPTPVVLFLYGGGWTSGSRTIYRFLGEALTSAGIAVGVAEYGLYPDVKYPGFLDDSALAFRFLREGEGFGVHSACSSRAIAGAYNTVMLGVNRCYLKIARRQGVIGIAGLYDFLPLTSQSLIAVFGGDNIEHSRSATWMARCHRCCSPTGPRTTWCTPKLAAWQTGCANSVPRSNFANSRTPATTSSSPCPRLPQPYQPARRHREVRVVALVHSMLGLYR